MPTHFQWGGHKKTKAIVFSKNENAKCKHVDLKTEKIILKCYIWSTSTLSTGSETWTLSDQWIKRLNAIEMWFYRKMQKMSWTENVKKYKVLKRISTEK
jgi:hypothetical protein